MAPMLVVVIQVFRQLRHRRAADVDGW